MKSAFHMGHEYIKISIMDGLQLYYESLKKHLKEYMRFAEVDMNYILPCWLIDSSSKTSKGSKGSLCISFATK